MDIEFLEDLPAVVLRPQGPMNVENFVRWGQELRAHPGYARELHQIIDLSSVDVSDLGRSEIDRIVSRAASLDYGPRTLIALVAPQSLSFGLARMYEIVASSDLPRNRAVFRAIEDAVEWVRTEQDSSDP